MLLRKIIVITLLLLVSKCIVIAQDSIQYVVPKWSVKWLPLAFVNPVNPNLEVAVATCLKDETVLQASFGYIDAFYNTNRPNQGFRTALEIQLLNDDNKNKDAISFLGIQLMYRQLHKADLELPVNRFEGAYQEFFPYKNRQDSWYLHCTIGEYYFVNTQFYFNWKIALGGRAYREFDRTKLPEDAELLETNVRFGVLDQPGEDWKLLPSLRLSFNVGFGW